MIRPGKLRPASVRVEDFASSRELHEAGRAAIPRPDLGLPGDWRGLGEPQLRRIVRVELRHSTAPTSPHFAIERGNRRNA